METVASSASVEGKEETGENRERETEERKKKTKKKLRSEERRLCCSVAAYVQRARAGCVV